MTPITLPDALSDAARSFVAGSHRLLIGDDRLDADDGRTLQRVDPAAGMRIADVAHAGPRDVDRAVGVARAALEDGRWSALPPSQRGRVLFALADLVEAHADELAELEALDNGK